MLWSKPEKCLSEIPYFHCTTHWYCLILIITHWISLPLKSLYMYAIGLFMYKFSNEMLPELFANMFIHVDEVHSYNTRNSANSYLYTSFHRTRRGQKCVKYTGPQVWNLVISKINPHYSIGCFKKSLAWLLKECSLSDLISWNSYQCPVASLYKLSELFSRRPDWS